LLNVAAGERPVRRRESAPGPRATERASFLRTHALARVEADDGQAPRIGVPVTTLDALVAEGQDRPAPLLTCSSSTPKAPEARGVLRGCPCRS
jgi:hypothetical protein